MSARCSRLFVLTMVLVLALACGKDDGGAARSGAAPTAPPLQAAGGAARGPAIGQRLSGVGGDAASPHVSARLSAPESAERDWEAAMTGSATGEVFVSRESGGWERDESGAVSREENTPNLVFSARGKEYRLLLPHGALQTRSGGQWSDVPVKEIFQRNNGAIIVIKLDGERIRLNLEEPYAPAAVGLPGLKPRSG